MDDHLGRDIRHDDLYEELAPTTHCKFNKKTHSHSPPLSFFWGYENQYLFSKPPAKQRALKKDPWGRQQSDSLKFFPNQQDLRSTSLQVVRRPSTDTAPTMQTCCGQNHDHRKESNFQASTMHFWGDI